jgi:sec-independent protein translocase protein TatA
MLHTLAIGMPGPFEWIIIAGLGLLIFGKRLPEVGKSLGKGIVEFKKGLKSVEDEVSMVDDDISSSSPRKSITHDAADHKFDPYTGKPIEQPKFDPYTGKPIDPAHEATSTPSEVHHD